MMTISELRCLRSGVEEGELSVLSSVPMICNDTPCVLLDGRCQYSKSGAMTGASAKVMSENIIYQVIMKTPPMPS